jgi:hypothetical protein
LITISLMDLSLCGHSPVIPRCSLIIFYFFFPIGDEEAVGERLYSVERYLTKTQQLL